MPSILAGAKTPNSIKIKIVGESLFNDGVGIVLFLALSGLLSSGTALSLSCIPDIAIHFFKEVSVSAFLGLIIGAIAFFLLDGMNDYAAEILITITTVLVGYYVVDKLHFSGPIALVVAGLLIGNYGKKFAMSKETRERLYNFWGIMDVIFNMVLFVSIGFIVPLIQIPMEIKLLGVSIFIVTIIARFISIGTPFLFLEYIAKKKYRKGTLRIVTWGGLRGGISIALAMTLPESPEKQMILSMTYIIVILSVVIQGLTVGRLSKFVCE